MASELTERRRILRAAGFVLDRQGGRHEVWVHPCSGERHVLSRGRTSTRWRARLQADIRRRRRS